MTSKVGFDGGLFENGPSLGLQTRLRLIEPGQRHVLRRAVLVVLIGWVPLAVLSLLQSSNQRIQSAEWFFSDIGVHSRSLIAAPLLVIAETVCAARLGAIARCFLDGGLIQEQDRPRFDATVASVRKLLDSTTVQVVLIVLSYAVVAELALSIPFEKLQGWYKAPGEAGNSLSLAGWWNALVSVPLLLVLFLGWMWRLTIWTRLLWLISRFDLNLIPTHPDRVAGLAFVGYSVRAFSIVALAAATVAAGRLANIVLYHGGPKLIDIIAATVFLVIIATLFVAPLSTFSGRLLEEWRRGVSEYGGLATRVGKEFECKWLSRDLVLDRNVLEASDFSAATDLNSVVSNVYQMHFVPLDLNSLILLLVTMCLPFVPVLLMAVPVGTILEALRKLLI